MCVKDVVLVIATAEEMLMRRCAGAIQFSFISHATLPLLPLPVIPMMIEWIQKCVQYDFYSHFIVNKLVLWFDFVNFFLFFYSLFSNHIRYEYDGVHVLFSNSNTSPFFSLIKFIRKCHNWGYGTSTREWVELYSVKKKGILKLESMYLYICT